MSADLVMFRLDHLGYAGALHDPLAALMFCTPSAVGCSIIDGRVVVRDGRLLTVELEPLVERHNRLAMALMTKTSNR